MRDAVQILLYEKEAAPTKRPYRIWALCDIWRARGIDVSIQVGVPDGPTDRIVVNHVDLTVLPPAYAAYLGACPRVVNRNVRDISKRRVSRSLVAPGDGYDGPVIVKTDANYGGRREAKWLHRSMPRMLRRFRRRTWADTSTLDPRAYPIYDTVDDLPAGVFDNPALVVERFMAERDGDLYVAHHDYFFGTQSVCFRRTCAVPIAKGRGTVDFVEEPAPPAIVAERARLGFDFGKFDFVMHAGEPRLLDANATAAFGFHGARREVQAHICAVLAAGLDDWLGRQPGPGPG